MDDSRQAFIHKPVSQFFKDDLNDMYKGAQKAATDAMSFVMIRLDDSLCVKLDAFVKAGGAENRRQAALYFLNEGLRATEGLNQRINATQNEVENLRQQLRSLKPLESTE